jgi:hypothetical protein
MLPRRGEWGSTGSGLSGTKKGSLLRVTRYFHVGFGIGLILDGFYGVLLSFVFLILSKINNFSGLSIARGSSAMLETKRLGY